MNHGEKLPNSHNAQLCELASAGVVHQMHATRLTDPRRALAHLWLAMASGDPEGLVEQLADLSDPDDHEPPPRQLGLTGAVRCRARCAAVRQAPLQYMAGRPPREPSAFSGLPHR